MTTLLKSAEIPALLSSLNSWDLNTDNTQISKVFVTQNFVEAVALINKIRDIAQDNNHHPDIHLTGYRKLRIELSTHSLGGLTNKDFDLATEIDKLPVKLKN
jgi:4a-hydroxytetrahydrobiopterin dehydratase